MQKRYLDIEGNFVKKTQDEFPYSYDPYVIYYSHYFEKSDLVFLSDKINGSCYASPFYNRIVRCNALEKMGLKEFGTSFERISWRNPLQVQKYLSILMKKPVYVTAITEGAYGRNGNPYWIIYVKLNTWKRKAHLRRYKNKAGKVLKVVRVRETLCHRHGKIDYNIENKLQEKSIEKIKEYLEY